MLPDGMGFDASQVSSKRKQKKKRIPNLITPMINALNYISSILNSEKKNIVNTIIGDFKSEIYPIQNNLIQTSIRINFIYQINKLTRRTATDLLLPPPSSLLYWLTDLSSFMPSPLFIICKLRRLFPLKMKSTHFHSHKFINLYHGLIQHLFCFLAHSFCFSIRPFK